MTAPPPDAVTRRAFLSWRVAALIPSTEAARLGHTFGQRPLHADGFGLTGTWHTPGAATGGVLTRAFGAREAVRQFYEPGMIGKARQRVVVRVAPQRVRKELQTPVGRGEQAS